MEIAHRVGFDYVWEVEHHFLEEYSHSSAPGDLRAMARVRAEVTAGFEDEIVHELTHTGNGRPADVWTLRVGDGKATATQARGQSSSVLVRMPLPDFARIICGELHPAAAVMEGEIELEGDLRVAARLGEMFGGASPY